MAKKKATKQSQAKAEADAAKEQLLESFTADQTEIAETEVEAEKDQEAIRVEGKAETEPTTVDTEEKLIAAGKADKDEAKPKVSRKPKEKRVTKKKPKKPAKSREQNVAEENFLADLNKTSEDMTKLQTSKSKVKRNLIIGLFLFLFIALGVSLAGFYIFNQGTKLTGSVELTLTGPKTVTAGSEVEYQVAYNNQETTGLRVARLFLRFPDGFHFVRSEPKAQNNNGDEYDLGSLAVGASGQVKITGILTGTVNSQKSFQATLIYRPVNFNSDFQKVTEMTSLIDSSLLGVEIIGPHNVVPDQAVDYSIKYHNTSDQDLNQVQISVKYPDQFVLLSSAPKLDPLKNKNEWQLEQLKAKADGEIKLNGKFGGEAGNNQELVAQLGIISDGSFGLQAEETLVVLLVNPQLKVNLKLNDQDKEVIADWGDELSYTITFQNQGDVVLANTELKLFFEEKIFDLAESKITQGKVSGNNLIFNPETTAKLKQIKPEDIGDLAFKVKLKAAYAPKSKEDTNYYFKQKLEVTTKGEGLADDSLTFSSNEMGLKVNSKVSLVPEARFYSEEMEPLGSGPLPPEVGATTTYRLFWYLTNTTNDLSKVTVSAVLPANVLWTGKGKVTAGDNLQFDPESRQVSWKIERVPALTGFVFPGIQASFEVSVTPEAKDEGKLMRLADATKVSAKDLFTGEKLELTKDYLTTELSTDVSGRGKGVVKPKGTTSVNTNTNLNVNSANTNTNVNTNINSTNGNVNASNSNANINSNGNVNGVNRNTNN